jgi:GINS complex subunit 2
VSVSRAAELARGGRREPRAPHYRVLFLYFAMAAWVSNAELEFFAEDELVTIVPKFPSPALELTCGKFGPFVPDVPCEVPLWLAIAWRRNLRCRVQAPRWLRKEQLAKVKRDERDSALSSLQAVPHAYIEIATLLLQHCAEDIDDVHEVRSLLEDIENLRQHKIRLGLQNMAAEQAQAPLQFLKVNNASAMEVNAIRPILLTTMTRFYSLYKRGTLAIVESKRYQRDLEALRYGDDQDEDLQADGAPAAPRNLLLQRAQAPSREPDRPAEHEQPPQVQREATQYEDDA